MANPTYSTQNIQSNILAFETLKQYGFCRQAASAVANTSADGFPTYPIDNSTGELQLGSIVKFDTDKWTPLTKAEIIAGVADEVIAVVIGTDEIGGAFGDIDPATGNPNAFATGDVGGMLLVNGVAMVRAQYLSGTGSTTAPTVAQIKAVIEDNMVQVKVVEAQDQFDGTYGDVSSITN